MYAEISPVKIGALEKNSSQDENRSNIRKTLPATNIKFALRGKGRTSSVWWVLASVAVFFQSAPSEDLLFFGSLHTLRPKIITKHDSGQFKNYSQNGSCFDHYFF